MLGVATNPIPVKAAMKLLGRGTGELRLPMCPLDAAGEAKVRQTLGGLRVAVRRQRRKGATERVFGDRLRRSLLPGRKATSGRGSPRPIASFRLLALVSWHVDAEGGRGRRRCDTRACGNPPPEPRPSEYFSPPRSNSIRRLPFQLTCTQTSGRVKMNDLAPTTWVQEVELKSRLNGFTDCRFAK